MFSYYYLTDVELLRLYRDGDNFAQQVLMQRYRIFSISLAKDLWVQFNKQYCIEISDLVSIGIMALHIATISYKTQSENGYDTPLYPYWKEIAIHEMHEYIRQFSAIRQDGLVFINATPSIDAELKFSSMDEEITEAEVIDFVTNPKNGYSKRDQKIFILFLQGIRYSELATCFHLSFPTVKRIINRIRSDIIKELF